jgi:hypothetical protein
MPFGMNFTDVRIDEATGRLTAYGESAANDDAPGLAEVQEIQTVLFAEGSEATCLWQRLRQPEAGEWSLTFEGSSPYRVDQRVYVVGLAYRPSAPPFAWSNLIEIKSESQPAFPNLEDAG